MTWCWLGHNWTKWGPVLWDSDNRYGYQTKECVDCKKVKRRWLI